MGVVSFIFTAETPRKPETKRLLVSRTVATAGFGSEDAEKTWQAEAPAHQRQG
jgi:hypothetical protein